MLSHYVAIKRQRGDALGVTLLVKCVVAQVAVHSGTLVVSVSSMACALGGRHSGLWPLAVEAVAAAVMLLALQAVAAAGANHGKSN